MRNYQKTMIACLVSVSVLAVNGTAHSLERSECDCVSNPFTPPECVELCGQIPDNPPDPGVPSPAPGFEVIPAPGETEFQDLFGQPLPRSISPEFHTEIVQSENFYLVYSHWIACGASLDFINGLLLECLSPAPTPEPAVCTKQASWSGGALWKPTSENTGNPVILLPKSGCGNITRVELLRPDGEKIANAKTRIDGKIRECGPNGGRPHYDTTAKASSYPANLIVRTVFDSGSTECRTVPNPSQRYD